LNHERADEVPNAGVGSVAAVGARGVGRVAVLGPGGVGGFLAAALARTAPPGASVTVVARRATVTAIEQRGLRVHSALLGEFTAHPRAIEHLQERVDVLFVATKAPGIELALRRVAVEPDLLVPLLNGLEHMELLRARYGRAHVAAGSIRIESERTEPAVIVQRSPQVRLELAADDPIAGARLPAVLSLLSLAGIPASIGACEKQVLWSKLVRLVALSATTAAFDEPLGKIRDDPAQQAALVACVREAAAVATAEGALVDPAETIAELDAAHPSLRSSLQLDVAAGRASELDAIQGAVLRAAAHHGLACPTIEQLTASIALRAGEPFPAETPG
jgi:2-dehydropantoate 2-reductase